MSTILGVVETALFTRTTWTPLDRFSADILGLESIGREAGRHVFFRVGNAQVLLLFRASETLRGEHVPSHGAKGAGHCALGVEANELASWRDRLTATGVLIEHEERWPPGGHIALFSRPGGKLGRIDHAGGLGIAVRVVTKGRMGGLHLKC